MLPGNPHYEPELRPLTGRDRPVIAYFRRTAGSQDAAHIAGFLDTWLPALATTTAATSRWPSVAPGGQHRSVYLVERNSPAPFSAHWATLSATGNSTPPRAYPAVVRLAAVLIQPDPHGGQQAEGVAGHSAAGLQGAFGRPGVISSRRAPASAVPRCGCRSRMRRQHSAGRPSDSAAC